MEDIFKGWETRSGDFMRPRKGDYLMPLDDCIRLFKEFKTTKERANEANRLYNIWEINSQSKK